MIYCNAYTFITLYIFIIITFNDVLIFYNLVEFVLLNDCMNSLKLICSTVDQGHINNASVVVGTLL